MSERSLGFWLVTVSTFFPLVIIAFFGAKRWKHSRKIYRLALSAYHAEFPTRTYTKLIIVKRAWPIFLVRVFDGSGGNRYAHYIVNLELELAGSYRKTSRKGVETISASEGVTHDIAGDGAFGATFGSAMLAFDLTQDGDMTDFGTSGDGGAGGDGDG